MSVSESTSHHLDTYQSMQYVISMQRSYQPSVRISCGGGGGPSSAAGFGFGHRTAATASTIMRPAGSSCSMTRFSTECCARLTSRSYLEIVPHFQSRSCPGSHVVAVPRSHLWA